MVVFEWSSFSGGLLIITKNAMKETERINQILTSITTKTILSGGKLLSPVASITVIYKKGIVPPVNGQALE